MGKQLTMYFKEAESLGALPAKIRFAMLARMASSQAEIEPDGPEHLATFAAAMKALREELRGAASAAPAARPTVADAGTRATRLDREVRAMASIMEQRTQPAATALPAILETTAKTLDVARASVWLYDDARTLIRCADLYEHTIGKHSAGVELLAKDFPRYFEALTHERTIAAHDARTDPRTSQFTKPYLEPLGITSMLDVPIWVRGRMAGVVCNEHVGPMRTWQDHEEDFAFTLGGVVALVLARRA